jgi:exodeoxyribonuclease X
MTLFRCIDFETTGFPPDAGIVEVGWCDVHVNGAPWIKDSQEAYSLKVGDWQSELTNPGKPIEIAAMAIHHITDDDVKGKRSPDTVLGELTSEVDYFVAHNAKFEKEFFSTSTPWICTLKAAYRLCPAAPNHQNQTIRYFLKTPVNKADAIHTHRAGPDAYVTAHTLGKFLTAVSPNTLAKWETEFARFPYCPIGQKWRGKPWAEVETSFLSWMINKAPDMEQDLKANAKLEMDRRFPQHVDRFKNV